MDYSQVALLTAALWFCFFCDRASSIWLCDFQFSMNEKWCRVCAVIAAQEHRPVFVLIKHGIQQSQSQATVTVQKSSTEAEVYMQAASEVTEVAQVAQNLCSTARIVR